MSADSAIEAIYDSFAATYDSGRTQFNLKEVLKDFQDRLPRSGDLLDLGCGAGEPVARAFSSQGWNVTGADVSQSMLDLAAQHVPQMTRVHCDMRALELPADSFNAVVAIYSLFHVPWTDHPTVFEGMSRWLRPGGLALFTYATSAYTGSERFNGTKDFMGQKLFYSHTTPGELREQLATAGLNVIDERDRLIGGESFLWITAEAS